MKLDEIAHRIQAQRALLTVAALRLRRAEHQSRMSAAQWRQDARVLQTERERLLSLDTDIARIRRQAQPEAGHGAITAATLTAWREHVHSVLQWRAEQNDKVHAAADMASQSAQQARDATQAALRATLKRKQAEAALEAARHQYEDEIENLAADEYVPTSTRLAVFTAAMSVFGSGSAGGAADTPRVAP